MLHCSPACQNNNYKSNALGHDPELAQICFRRRAGEIIIYTCAPPYSLLISNFSMRNMSKPTHLILFIPSLLD